MAALRSGFETSIDESRIQRQCGCIFGVLRLECRIGRDDEDDDEDNFQFFFSPFFLADADFLVQRKPRDQLIPNRWIRPLLSLVHPAIPRRSLAPSNDFTTQSSASLMHSTSSQGFSFFSQFLLSSSPYISHFSAISFSISPFFFFLRNIQIWKCIARVGA